MVPDAVLRDQRFELRRLCDASAHFVSSVGSLYELLWRGPRFRLSAISLPPTPTVRDQPALRCATDRQVMDIDPTCPEWVLRQDFACVFVRAPSPVAAVELAAKRLGHMGGWKVGPDADQKVFRWEEYREHARTGDYTRSVILGPRS